jgi:hypothetical protein
LTDDARMGRRTLEGSAVNAGAEGRANVDPFDHPLYRIAHLHGSTWVTLRPEDQHGRSDDLPLPWPGATVYRCETCEERVVIGPD